MNSARTVSKTLRPLSAKTIILNPMLDTGPLKIRLERKVSQSPTNAEGNAVMIKT